MNFRFAPDQRLALAQGGHLAQNQFRFMLREPVTLITMFVGPFVLAVFLIPSAEVALQSKFGPSISGADYVVPGLTAMFSTLGVNMVNYAYFREFIWRTWPRVNAVGVPSSVIHMAKLAPITVAMLAQTIAMMLAGTLLYDMHLGFKSAGAYLFTFLLLHMTWLAFGLLLVATASSLQLASGIAQLALLILGGLGGSLTPVGELPPFIQVLQPLSPTFHAVKAATDIVTQQNDGLVPHLAALAAMALMMVALAGRAWRRGGDMRDRTV